jgi:hypothetical protein
MEAIAIEMEAMKSTMQNEELNCCGLLCSERYQSKARQGVIKFGFGFELIK